MAKDAGVVLVAAAGWHDEAPGGANRLPTEFARYLVTRGYRVTYLCASDLVHQVMSTVIDGVAVWRYPSPKAPSPSLANVGSHWRLTRAIVRSIQAERPVIALLGHAPLQYLAATTACAPGVRRCYGAHSPLSTELAHGASVPPTWKHRIAWRIAKLMEQRLLAASGLVHCDSDYTRRLMESEHARTLRGKTTVLPGWVDTSRFGGSCVSRDQLRARLGTPWQPATPTFFTLRRLVPRMGIDTLIEAAAALAQNGRRFRVVIGGEGPERQRLEALVAARRVADRVAFIGRIRESDLGDTYAAADCFVLPTRALECFGLIVLEAYASGIPVIGVPVGAIPEVMGSEFARWVAADNRAAALAERMDDFLAEKLVADPARLRGRALEFDLPVVARVHEERLLGVASGYA